MKNDKYGRIILDDEKLQEELEKSRKYPYELLNGEIIYFSAAESRELSSISEENKLLRDFIEWECETPLVFPYKNVKLIYKNEIIYYGSFKNIDQKILDSLEVYKKYAFDYYGTLIVWCDDVEGEE